MGRKQKFKSKHQRAKDLGVNVKVGKANKWTRGNASSANPSTTTFRDRAAKKDLQTNPSVTGNTVELMKLHGLIDHDTENSVGVSSVINDPLSNIFKDIGLEDNRSFKSNVSGISDCTNSTGCILKKLL